MDRELSRLVVRHLLDIKAIKFNFEKPFTWVSGIQSPVYCDNRISLSYHGLRSLTKKAYTQMIQETFPDVEVIAGVATGAVAQGALVADVLGLPFIYVREKRKEHGMMKVIEGHFEKGQKTVVLEDLISTGGSSLKAWEELRDAGADVLGMAAAFSYDFAETNRKFTGKGYRLCTIASFQTLKDVALEEGYISEQEAKTLDGWHRDPLKLNC